MKGVKPRPWEWTDYIVIAESEFADGRGATYRIRCAHAELCGGYTSKKKTTRSAGMFAFRKHWEAKHAATLH